MRIHRKLLSRGAALTGATALVVGPVAAPSHADDIDGVPVVGQAEATPTFNRIDGARKVVITLHSVRRVEDVTVVYWSAGFRADSKKGDRADLVDSFGSFGFTSLFRQRFDSDVMCDVGAVDTAARQVYTPLATGQGDDLDCVATDFLDGVNPTPGEVSVFYATLPALPEDLDQVSITVAGRVFAGVPIETGPLEPQKPNDKPIPVGTGWPTVDLEAAARADQEASVYPLTEHTMNLTGDLARRKESGKTSLDISADVLFAVDKATLTPKAENTLTDAAKKITDDGATGTLSITGHTDSDGSDSHNMDLSTRRAQAVADKLTPMLPDGLTIEVEGKGESEPIASNETDEGKALNRRVTASFTTEGNS